MNIPSFPKSRIDRFEREYWSQVKGSMRYGQAFHSYLGLEKLSIDKYTDGNISEEKVWLDRLYNADDATAKKMIEEHTDFNN